MFIYAIQLFQSCPKAIYAYVRTLRISDCRMKFRFFLVELIVQNDLPCNIIFLTNEEVQCIKVLNFSK